jgi:DNA-binding transcriptional MerR regulator
MQKGSSVDAIEFLKRVKPAGPRSRLAPYWADIQYLRKAGCTLEQVREFLAENNVSVTVAGLSQYIRRREQKESQEQNKAGIETRISKPNNDGDTKIPPKPKEGSKEPGETKPKKRSGLLIVKKPEINLEDYIDDED